jgi:cytochrome b6-f complex iron-sulfur subunit
VTNNRNLIALSKKNLTPPKAPTKPKVSKSELVARLSRLQLLTALSMFGSAALGTYLLATDRSLWLLAVSHAYGLVAICVIDVVLGIANVASVRRAIVPSIGWAILTLILQIGDISTASQYHLTVGAFASYLFGLWAFDTLLISQGIILFLANSARGISHAIARRKVLNYFDMGRKDSRRDFLQIGGTFGALFVIAAALGIWAQLSASSNSAPVTTNNSGTNITSTLPSGAVANLNSLEVGVPVYFDYPSAGFTNMLMKKSNGSVSALSILCTHVCCTCQYDSSSKELYCPCHGSVFDQKGNVLNGPAQVKLPSIQLRIDSSGNIFPVKVLGSGPCVQA